MPAVLLVAFVIAWVEPVLVYSLDDLVVGVVATVLPPRMLFAVSLYDAQQIVLQRSFVALVEHVRDTRQLQ